MKTDLNVLSARCWPPLAIRVHLVGYLDPVHPVLDFEGVDLAADLDQKRHWVAVPVDFDLVDSVADLVEVSVADRQHNQVAYTASNEQ